MNINDRASNSCETPRWSDGSIAAIHWQLSGPDVFLSLVKLGAKLGETMTHPGQPLIRRTPGLGQFQAIFTGDPGGEQTQGHGLTRPTSTGHWRRNQRLFGRLQAPGGVD